MKQQYAHPLGVYGDFQTRKFFSSGSTQSQLILLGVLSVAILMTVVGSMRISAQARTLVPVTSQQPAPVAEAPKNIAPAAVTTPPATPAATYSATSEDLQNLINSWTAQNSPAKWGVYVQELGGSNRAASYQDAKTYEPASVFKLFMVTNLLKRLEAGTIKPEDVLTDGYTVDTCITKAIELSDNVCANAYGDKFDGWNKTQKMLNAANLTQLKIGANPQTITAQGVGQYFSQLYTGKLLNADNTKRLIGHLSHTVYRKGIPAGCTGCSVANKVGDNPDALNDVALVQHNDVAYVLVILSDKGSYAKIAELTKQIDSLLLKTTVL